MAAEGVPLSLPLPLPLPLRLPPCHAHPASHRSRSSKQRGVMLRRLLLLLQALLLWHRLSPRLSSRAKSHHRYRRQRWQ